MLKYLGVTKNFKKLGALQKKFNISRHISAGSPSRAAVQTLLTMVTCETPLMNSIHLHNDQRLETAQHVQAFQKSGDAFQTFLVVLVICGDKL